ncbi:MAG: addiction module protein [Candidatus Sumerlaeota bacterium]|nr:addiction module protein [Candidatus Sumerlaeota bacterium]
MSVTIPLEQMTLPEKLRALEDIWSDLCQNSENIPSPSWHGEVLRDREILIEQGKESSLDWEEAKKKIRESVK